MQNKYRLNKYIYKYKYKTIISHTTYIGGSHLSWIFWEHENLSSLSLIWLISTNLH